MRKKILVGMALGLVTALALTTPATAVGVPERNIRFGEISILHAVPNTPVDVWVDGERVINNFKPGRFAGPLNVAAGTYTVAITGSTARNDNDPVIGPVELTVTSKANYTLVAHLDEEGAPTATFYKNNVSKTSNGMGRLIVRHTAAAPTVDILAGGAPVITGLTNPDQKSLVIPAGTVPAAVALTGTTAPVIGPADVAVRNQRATIVYAWGSAADGTLALAVQTIAFKSTKNGHHASSAAGSKSYGKRQFGW